MKRLTLDRDVAGISYQVKELTVEEIRVWLVQLEQAYNEPKRPGLIGRVAGTLGISHAHNGNLQGVVDAMLFDDIAMSDLTLMTTLSADQIEKLTPTEIRGVWELCKEVNADFFALRLRLEKIGQASRQVTAVTSNALSPA